MVFVYYTQCLSVTVVKTTHADFPLVPVTKQQTNFSTQTQTDFSRHTLHVVLLIDRHYAKV